MASNNTEDENKNVPRHMETMPEGTALPEEIDFMAGGQMEGMMRASVFKALKPHVINYDNHNIYTPGTETIQTPNGDINITVQTREIEGKRVTETIVEPADTTKIKETEICLGGYSINTPYYYRSFVPYALTGKRYVFINLLGGGTEDYQERNLNAPILGGDAGLKGAYFPESGAHISDLIARYSAVHATDQGPMNEGTDHGFTLSGESTGGLVISNLLANRNYLSDEMLRKVRRVVLDSPVPTGRMPFGNLGTLKTTWTTLKNGQFGAIFGRESNAGTGMIGDLMMADYRKQGTDHAERIITDTTAACFKATGVFPQMALLAAKDPVAALMQSDNPNDGLRRAILGSLDVNIFYREKDTIVPTHKLWQMANRWSAAGLNVLMAQGNIHSKSHLDLPGMNAKEVWRQHGLNGRLQPLQDSNKFPVS